MRARDQAAAAPWAGPYRRYDIVKEFVVALVAVSLVALALALVFSSPDDKSVSVAQWANATPNDFVATTVAELDGTSGSANYGAPYNTNGPGQKLGPLGLQKLAGVTIAVDSANDFVLQPLSGVPGDAGLTAALATYKAASADQQTKWATAYGDGLSKATDNDPAKVAAGDYGPVPLLSARLLDLARSGGLDGVLLAEGGFYKTDYTKPLLFLADGTYLSGLAQQQHLTGTQWGMMNETGRYPGQAWLWLYTFWYQVRPMSKSGNADALVWAIMALLTLLFVLVPFVPGLRDLPRRIPIYRLIWRNHYRSAAGSS